MTKPDRCCVAVIAKFPEAGRVKTRLAATVGAERAAELCEAFLRDTLDNLRANSSAQRCLFFDPPEAEPWFEQLDPEALRIPQPALAFGERLVTGFEALFARGFERVLFIGCDAPHVSGHAAELALEALEHQDLVLGPTEDGGYYMVGLRAPQPELFNDIAWSTESVLSDTLEQAERLSLRHQLLEKSFDIDEEADLERLRTEWGAKLATNCPHTAKSLG